MAETSHSVTGPAASPSSLGAAQNSNMDFWYDIYTNNLNNSVIGPSRLDYEWGYVFGNSSSKTNKRKKKDVGSTSTAYSNSDLSEALSAISAHLSLSSSGSSSLHSSREGDQYQDTEKDVAGFMKNHVGIFQDETLDNSTENCARFDIHSLSSESDEDDALSSSSNEDEIQYLSTFNASKGTQEDNFQVPDLGMVFSSDGEVYEFYKKYAKRIGFTVRKGKVHRSSNGDIRERFFFCSREGFRSKKQANKLTKFKRKETRTGCRARIRCTVENGKWVISQFCQEHNHQLDGFSKTFEPYLVLPTRNEAGATKYFEFGKMGCSTYVHEAKINSLQAEDAQSLINYFRHMQVEDSSFFYAVQVDANGCMTNFFWTDGRSKIDYEYFGDVLILDTAFKMDKFGMICAPFLGLNHHQQYVLFGCAFLLDKSNDSFCWLFETFMEAMRRRQPKTIFTDEGQPMVDAVKMVMPEANHRLGLWYVFRNVSKHLPTYYGQPDFASLFNKCISGCDTEEEFESRWSSLLEQFDLHKNPCLNTLYMYRKRWAHVFNKRTFGAGIHCLENIKNIFQNFTSETMSLPKFVQQYFLAAEQQRREELYEDFHCNGSAPEMTLHYGLVEKQAASIYTCTVFSAFQEEWRKLSSVALREISSNGPISTFKLTEVGPKESILEYNCLDSSVICSCGKYESVGILCAHALKVLNARNMFCIPPQYVLKRWTKSAKDGIVTDLHGQEVTGRKQKPVDFLMRKALDVITKGVSVKESQDIVEDCLDMTLKRVEGVLKAKNINDLKTTDAEAHYEDSNGVCNQLSTEVMKLALVLDVTVVRGPGSTYELKYSFRKHSEKKMGEATKDGKS